MTHFSTMTSLALALIGGGLVIEGLDREVPRNRVVAGAGAFLLGMLLGQVFFG